MLRFKILSFKTEEQYKYSTTYIRHVVYTDNDKKLKLSYLTQRKDVDEKEVLEDIEYYTKLDENATMDNRGQD